MTSDIRPIRWASAPFAKLQALPKDGKPVTTWRNRDQAWVSVDEGVARAIEELAAVAAPPASEEKVKASHKLRLERLRKRALDRFWAEAEFEKTGTQLVEEVFGPITRWTANDYLRDTYEAISITVEMGGKKHHETIYYGLALDEWGRRDPLDEFWWAEFLEAMERFHERYYLLVTQRPVSDDDLPGRAVTYARGSRKRVTKIDPGLSMRGWKTIVVVDLSGNLSIETRRRLLGHAGRMLRSAVEEDAAESTRRLQELFAAHHVPDTLDDPDANTADDAEVSPGHDD